MSHPNNSNNNNINYTSDQVSSEHGTHTGGNSDSISKDNILDKFNSLILSFDNKSMDKNNFVPGMKMFIYRMKRDGLGCLLENDAESVLGTETLKIAGEFFLFFKNYFPDGFDSSDGLQILIDIDAGIYDKSNVSEIKDIIREWSNLSYDGSVSAVTYINKVKKLIAKTKKYHCEMSEYEMKRRIIASMRKDYRNVHNVVLNQNDGRLNVEFEKIYKVIMNMYDEKELEASMTCRFDKDPFARQVFRNKENHENKNSVYNKRPNEGSVKSVSSNKPVVCYNCQQEGHIRPDCPELKEKEEKVKEIKLVNERVISASTNTLRPRLVKKVLRTDQSEISGIMYDTGAESSIVPKEWLHDPKPNLEHFCEDFNGNKINVPYVGKLILKTRGKVFSLEALGTVDLDQMVIGRSSLKNAGLIVNELDKCIYEISTKSVVGQVVEKDNSIYIPESYILYPEKLNILNVNSKKLFDLYHIHVLCGHINVKDLQRSIKIGSIVGIKYEDINWTGIDNFKCDSCMKGKSTYKKHYVGSRASHQDQYDAGEYFHSDLFGPLPDINPKYPNSFISFIDEKSKFRFVYPLKSKSAESIVNILQEFIPYVERNLGKTIKVIHSDQGNEYRNEDVRKYLQEFGIRQIFTTKGDSKANGVAERLNYTLLNDARTLMLNDNIPRSLWFFAVGYSCHVRNGIIAASNAHGMSPRQLLGIDKLDISNLLPFGTHVILHSREDDKLSARGIDGYILSPSHDSYGYKIWAKSLRRIIDSSSFKIASNPFTDHQSKETAIDEFIRGLAKNDESLKLDDAIPELEDDNDDQIYEGPSEQEPVSIINKENSNSEVDAGDIGNPAPTIDDSIERIDDSQCDENSEPEIIIDVDNDREGEKNLDADNKLNVDNSSSTDQEFNADSESEFSVENMTDSEYQEDTSHDNETSVDDAKDPEYKNTDANSEGLVLSDKWSVTKRGREDDSGITDDEMGHFTDEGSAKVNIKTGEIIDDDDDDGKPRKMTEEEIINYINKHPDKFANRKRVRLRKVVAIRAVKNVKVTPDIKHSTGDTLYLHEIYGLTNREVKNKYISAYRKELKNLEDSGTYDKNDTISVDAVDKKQIVPLLSLFNVKRSGEYKCRIVARGDEQDESTFNRDLSSSNLSHDGLMLILNIAFVNKLKIYQLDIKAAYLNAKLDEDIYVVTPSIYRKKNTVLKLKKSLYGLKQSGHLWNVEICKKLNDNGFKLLKYWSSIFIKKEDSKMIIIGLFVDDMIITTNDDTMFEEVLVFLNKFYEIKVINDGSGEEYDILGIQVDYKIGTHLSMCMGHLQGKISNLIADIDNSVKELPIVRDLKIPEKIIANITDYATKNKFMQRAIGLLNYVAMKYRYDIMFTVNFLSRYQLYPSDEILKATKKLLSYVYNTSNYKLMWKYENIVNGELKLVSDASHSNAEEYKSQYGYLIYWNNLIVGAKTGVTTISCISSTEAEIFSMVKGMVTIKNWLTGTKKINKKERIIVECDNKSAILLCSSYNVSKFRDKFHGIRAYRMRQEKEKLKFKFMFVKSKENESDVLTKFNPDKKNIEKFMELFDR